MKNLLSFILFLLPPFIVKNILLNLINEYNISLNSHIGINFIWNVRKLVVQNGVHIGHLNIFKDINQVKLEKESQIKHQNKFKNAFLVKLHKNSYIGNKNFVAGIYNIYFSKEESKYSILELKEKSTVTAKHHFDILDKIIIGVDTVIGGNQTQFWTHGFDIERNRIQGPIRIGNNCYVASRCLIGHGIKIANKTTIGMGTVVSKSINEEGFFWVSNKFQKKGRNKNLKCEYTNKKVGEYDGKSFFREKKW